LVGRLLVTTKERRSKCEGMPSGSFGIWCVVWSFKTKKELQRIGDAIDTYHAFDMSTLLKQK